MAGEEIAVAALSRPFDGPEAVGGDFCARCETGRGTVRVIIGDVRGKGAPAARKARLLTEAFLETAPSCAELEDVAGALDRLAARDAAAEWDAAAQEWFATAVLLEVDRDGHTVRVLNLGHPAPLLLGPGTVRELAPSSPRLPLGLGRLAAVSGFPDTVELAADSALLLFTDGVNEARDADGRMFDPVAWLAEAGSGDAGARDPAALLERLLAEVERHNGGMWRDDLALMSVRRHGSTYDESAPVAPEEPSPARVAAPRTAATGVAAATGAAAAAGAAASAATPTAAAGDSVAMTSAALDALEAGGVRPRTEGAPSPARPAAASPLDGTRPHPRAPGPRSEPAPPDVPRSAAGPPSAMVPTGRAPRRAAAPTRPRAPHSPGRPPDEGRPGLPGIPGGVFRHF